jgi:deoxyribodipyrimidine photo-lyase
VTDLARFPPTREEALRRIDAISPAAYARSRNAIDGAVSGLSLYLTHGVVTMRETLGRLLARYPELGWHDKIVFELAWREYWQHVWRHRGEAVLADLRRGLEPPGGYAAALPADVREARTGVGAIDMAVRTLYATGYLHNHARMWLASYVVHLRKVHWRAGADWMYGHLLDGDVPSNHLSWQWVAGTFSSRPYLFNAENVARHAPRAGRSAWLAYGSAVDHDYATLEQVARGGGDVGPEPEARDGVAEPPLLRLPPEDACRGAGGALDRARELVHPWALGERPSQAARRLGVVHLPAHAALPWSERRWRWVLGRLRRVCDAVFLGDLRELSAMPGTSVTPAPFPGYAEAVAGLADPAPAPHALPEPGRAMQSFSAFYAAVRASCDTPASCCNHNPRLC